MDDEIDSFEQQRISRKSVEPIAGTVRKRDIFPLENWKSFLVDAKKEFQMVYELKSSKEYGKNDFEFIRTIGKGAFGRVYVARMLKNGKIYAIKVLDKANLVKTRQTKHAITEKKILQALNFPFCVHLVYSFMDNSYLYFTLPFITGGEMYTLLRKMKRFDEVLVKFYGAQIILAFEYIHFCDLVFRDLKPENILVDQKGYLKLTDFGFAKVVKGRTYTLCGTPEYLAPEIILNKGYGTSVDWWTFGVLLYEMASGYPPFHAREPIKIYEKVVSCKYDMPKFFSKDLSNLIENILQVELSRRFGNLKNGVNDIKEHPFYQDLDWIDLLNLKIEAPFIPNVQGPTDSSNFDKYKEISLEIAKRDLYSKDFLEF